MDLSGVVKAYDVRGIVPDQLDESIARALGAAFVDVLGAAALVTAHDMRETGPGLARAFAEGALHRGASVIETGLGSTDMLYFASGSLGLPGAMFTASHNPARYNGIKFCRAGARRDRAGHRARRDPRRGRGVSRRRPAAGRRRRAPSRGRPAHRVRRVPALARRPDRHPPAQGRRRRRQRHGRLHRAGRAGRHRPACPAADDRPAVLRAGRLVPEPRGQPTRAGQPGRPAATRSSSDGADLGPRLRRRRRPVLRRRRRRCGRVAERDHLPGRGARAAPLPGAHRHPQPDHLARRPGGDPRTRRACRCAPGRPLD